MRFPARTRASYDVANPARSAPFVRGPATPFTSLGVECLDTDADTELAFQKVRLARQLRELPAPKRTRVYLPSLSRQANESIRASVQHLYQVAADAS